MTEDAQSFLIYNLLCPLFLYIDSSVLVVLHFVLFKPFNGITAPSPCLTLKFRRSTPNLPKSQRHYSMLPYFKWTSTGNTLPNMAFT